ncbi:cob(I)yrinic acid a,c-diamide adenosyltransferase [Candidatus Peregrinibacteria bacterium]|nr:cob(I)yrinic acid a,c-diamide adenosyltransferase [Candidatus Peregrinibacteria bacterium]
MSKIYTKTGDRGETGLRGGKRVLKDDLRIEVIGEVDELNAILGVCISKTGDQELHDFLKSLQRELFGLGAHLAGGDFGGNVGLLEKWIDEIDAVLADLQNFILPGGSEIGALLHNARSVCRRLERSLVKLSRVEKVDANVLAFVNRLSDFLFVFARFANKKAGIDEEIWKG